MIEKQPGVRMPVKILAIGNSFSKDVTRYFKNIADCPVSSTSTSDLSEHYLRR